MPVHIHYVVQPVTREQMQRHHAYGPGLQMAMFENDVPPHADAVERLAEEARKAFTSS